MDNGRNADIVSRSPVLSGYTELVAEVPHNSEAMELADAIKAAIKSCIECGILERVHTIDYNFRKILYYNRGNHSGTIQ